MSFSLDMSKFIAKAKGNADKVVRKVVIDLATSVILKNPVGDPDLWKSSPSPGYAGGRSRANWQYGSGAMPGGITDGLDKEGSKTIAAVIAGVSSAPTSSIHWISNSLDYIVQLEDGSSTQAPEGMVKLTVLEFNSIVNGAAQSVPK